MATQDVGQSDPLHAHTVMSTNARLASVTIAFVLAVRTSPGLLSSHGLTDSVLAIKWHRGLADPSVLTAGHPIRRLFVPVVSSNRQFRAEPTPLVSYRLPTPGPPDTQPSPPTSLNARCVVTGTTSEDATPIRITYNQFNEKGFVLKGSSDEGADGTIDATSWLTYRNGSLLVSYLSDNDGNNTADYYQFRQYRDDDTLTLVSLDSDGDGTYDSSQTTVYSIDNGVLTSQVWSTTRGSVNVQLIAIYRYAPDGALATFENLDPGFDLPDELTSFTWQNGLLRQVSTNSGTPPKLLWQRHLQYDESSRLIAQDFSTADQRFRSRETFEYNTRGLIWRNLIYDYDDLENVIEYEYDGLDRLVQLKRFQDITTYHYSCPE